MGKMIMISIFAVLFVLITFFGMGPVLFADGTSGERMMTLLVVLLLYVVLGTLFGLWFRRQKKK